MDLTAEIWQNIEGGYRTPYNPTFALKKLKASTASIDVKEVWDELWNELHHQGDVGLASYLSLPKLADIGLSKEFIDWNYLGLINCIEQARHSHTNPLLQKEYRSYYEQGLKNAVLLSKKYLETKLDKTTLLVSLATNATCSGRIEEGKTFLELEDKATIEEMKTLYNKT